VYILFCFFILRDATGITVEQLSGFTVPMWMIEKMRIQMVAMRTDLPKQAKYRSRSATPNEASFVPVEVGILNFYLLIFMYMYLNNITKRTTLCHFIKRNSYYIGQAINSGYIFSF
jgi:hypothetical protein